MMLKPRPLVFAFSRQLVSATLIFGMTFLPLAQAQVVANLPPSANAQDPEASADPQAVVLSVSGACEYADDGITFAVLKSFKEGAAIRSNDDGGAVKQLWGHVFKQGAVVRAGKDTHIDIFFRRIGTTIRLQPDTEIKFEKMARQSKDGASKMQTVLALPKGRIFVVVRSFVEGSDFEVKNAAGRSVIEGGGKTGRYIITADGSHVSDKRSDIPLKVIGETGVTVITPGQKFLAKEGKLMSIEPSEIETSLIEFDELESMTEQAEKQ